LDSATREKLIVALDVPDLAAAWRMARRLAGHVGMFKVGSQLFVAAGPRVVEKLAGFGARIFLDLKFHDIPNTVVGAVRAAAGLPGVRLINVHALGGLEMMRVARAALGGRRRPRLIAVTVLTSQDRASLRRTGIAAPPLAQALKLARLARQAGLDGVVASAQEVRAIRRACGSKFLVVVPGVRPGGARRGDQARVATPAEAIRAGADYIVVGRPITEARDPVRAAEAVLAEIASALRTHGE